MQEKNDQIICQGSETDCRKSYRVPEDYIDANLDL